MLRHIQRFLLVAVAAVLAGCAGTPFTFGRASQVKVGMTEDQLYEIMGNPYMVTSRKTARCGSTAMQRHLAARSPYRLRRRTER